MPFPHSEWPEPDSKSLIQSLNPPLFPNQYLLSVVSPPAWVGRASPPYLMTFVLRPNSGPFVTLSSQQKCSFLPSMMVMRKRPVSCEHGFLRRRTRSFMSLFGFLIHVSQT